MYKSFLVSITLLASLGILFPTTLAAQTDMGTVAVASSSSTTVTVTLSSAATLGSLSVRTQGVENLDFTNAGGGTCKTFIPYAANATCTVVVNFRPTLPGVRPGAVVLSDAVGRQVGLELLRGWGTGPLVHFPGATETVIGSGWKGPPCCMVVDGAGALYIADTDHLFKETPAGGGYSESIISANDRRGSMTMDPAGNLYISENQVIYKETLSIYDTYSTYSESPTTIGIGLSQQANPKADSHGNIFIADAFNGRVLKETPSGDTYTQSVVYTCGFVGAQSCPAGVAIDSHDNLFVTSYYPSGVVKLAPSGGGYASPVDVGSGFVWVSDIAVDGNDNLYIADTLNSRIVKETLQTDGSYSQSVIPTSGIDWPWAVAVDSGGNVFIADTYHSRYLREDVTTPPNLTFAATSVGSTSSDSPKVVTVENAGNALLSFPVPATGQNPNISSGFSLDGSPTGACPLIDSSAATAPILDGGKTCQLSISYKPTDANTFVGTLVMTDDNLNASTPNFTYQSIGLSVVGSPKDSSQTVLQVSPGSVIGGDHVSFTASVTGTAGGPVPTGTVTFSGLGSSGLDSVLDANGVGVVSLISAPVGNYSVVATYSGDSKYLGSSSQPSSLIVSTGPPSKITLGWFIGQGYQYGFPPAQLAVVVSDSAGNPIPGVKVNFSGSDIQITDMPGYALPPVTDASGRAIVVVQALKAGALMAHATVAGTSVQASFPFTVDPASLTVTMHSALRFYGHANPVFTSTLRGLVGSDKLIVLPQTAASPISMVGSYPVTATVSGPDAANYSVTIVPATLQVRKARLNVTASSYVSQYGQTPSQPTAYSFFGFMNGNTASVVSGSPTLSTAVTATTHVGYYPFNLGSGTLSATDYFMVPFAVHSVLHVSKAPLTVSADDVIVHRGDPMPALTYRLSGFVNGDAASVVTGTAILRIDARSNTRPGTYPIYISAGSLKANDYRMNCVRGTLTILP